MPRKFKVGDRVVVVRALDPTYELLVTAVGHVGQVREVNPRFESYLVRVPGIHPTRVDGIADVYCDARELDHAPAKKKAKKKGK